MSTKIHCTRLICLEYHPLAFGPIQNLPIWLRKMVAALFPKLYQTLMLVYAPTTPNEIDIIVATVRAGARHVGSGEFGYRLDTDNVGCM